MKKLLALTLSLASLGFVATSAEAKAAGSPAAKMASHASVPPGRGQIERGRRNDRNDRWDRHDRRNHGRDRVRTVIQTRIVRYHGRAYRETIQIKYWPNGRTETRVLNRVWLR